MVSSIPIALGDTSIAGRTTAPDPNVQRVSLGQTLDFGSPNSYELDFTITNQSKTFGILRSMSADNTNNPNAINVYVSVTNQTFTIPSYSQGFFPLNTAPTSKVTLTSDGGAGAEATSVVFYNYEQQPTVWGAVGTNPSGNTSAVHGTMQAGDTIASDSDNQPVYIAGLGPTGNLTPVGVTSSNEVKVAFAATMPVSIANGADIALGSTPDSAWSGSGNATLISIEKSIYNNTKTGTPWAYAASSGGIVNSNSPVLLIAAGSAGVVNYLKTLDVMAEALATATEFIITSGSGGTVLWRTKLTTAGIPSATQFIFDKPLQSAPATALYIQCVTASATGAIYANAQGYSA